MSIFEPRSRTLTKLAALAALAGATVAFAASDASAASSPAWSLSKPLDPAAAACSWEWMGTINNGCSQTEVYQFPLLNASLAPFQSTISANVTGYSNGPNNLAECQEFTLDPNRDQSWGSPVPIPANTGVGSPYHTVSVSGPLFNGGVAFIDCWVPVGDGINQVFW